MAVLLFMKWFRAGCFVRALVLASAVAAFANGPVEARPAVSVLNSPNVFPIAVWLQGPQNAGRYRAAGINCYVGLWEGPTEEQLQALKAAGMPVICEQNAVGLAHRSDPTIVGWMHGDEPDNAQPVTDPATGKQSYGPPVPPPRIVAEYHEMKAKDPSRPVMLNLGQGVANDEWVGRGSGAHPDDYLTYVRGADIVSFDIYPIAGLEKPHPEEYLWYIARGIDRLKAWTGGRQRLWNCIECTRISGGRKATPEQVKSEVWMSMIHGSTGLIYFVHQFQPEFDEWALLDDPVMLPAVTAINHQIQDLAPVLNSPTRPELVRVQSTQTDVPVDVLCKRRGGATYLFAVGMRNGPTRAAFTLRGLPPHARATVIGENRTIDVRHGQFADAFVPYGVHLYRVR